MICYKQGTRLDSTRRDRSQPAWRLNQQPPCWEGRVLTAHSPNTTIVHLQNLFSGLPPQETQIIADQTEKCVGSMIYGSSGILRTDRRLATDRPRERAADEGWENTICQMRAEIERRPLTTSCLEVTTLLHLSVCVPGWTWPRGQWQPGQQPRVAVGSFCASLATCNVMFVCVRVRSYLCQSWLYLPDW